MMKTGTGRIFFADLLRAASILYIVGFWHLMNYTNAFPAYHNQLTIRITVVILGLFVFLSGYFLGQKKLTHKNSIKVFYVRRFLRIYPLYFVALWLFLLFHFINAGVWLKSCLSISMFDGPSPPTLWFITMLLVFYLVAPLFIREAKENILVYLFLTTAVLVIMILIMMISSAGDSRIIIYFPAFVLGVYWATHDIRQDTRLYLICAVLVFLSIILSVAVRNNPEESLRSMPLACFTPLAIFLLIERGANHFPESRIIYELSYAGFVMYLIHRPVYMIMLEMYYPATADHQLIYLVFICLPLIVALSWLVQLVYDNLMQKARSAVGGTT